MIGYVPKILAELVAEAGPPGAMARALSAVGMDPETEFRIDRNYPDGAMFELVHAACGELGVDIDSACETVAHRFLDDAVERFPAFFSMSKDARSLLTRQPRIHVCMAAGVKNIAPGDEVNRKFQIEERENGDLLVTYASPNRLGRLYKALAEAAIERYGETAVVTHLDDIDGTSCRFQISWSGHG